MKEEIDPEAFNNEDEELVLMFKLYNGVGIKVDQVKAKQICLKYAEKGHLLALAFKDFLRYEVKDAYKQLETMKEEITSMFEHAKKYQEKNQDKASEEKKDNQLLGYSLCLQAIYHDFYGKKSLVLELYEKAIILADNPLAYARISELHEYGKIDDLPEKEASSKMFEYLLKSEEREYSWASYQLGYCYHRGYKTAKDLQKAIQHLKIAAKYDHAHSLMLLSRIHSMKGDDQDFNLVAHYWIQMLECEKRMLNTESLYKNSVTNSLQTLLAKEIDWRQELHLCWNFSDREQATKTVLLLLLISKHRTEFTGIASQAMIKGITTNIIKFFCNLSQRIK